MGTLLCALRSCSPQVYRCLYLVYGAVFGLELFTRAAAVRFAGTGHFDQTGAFFLDVNEH